MKTAIRFIMVAALVGGAGMVRGAEEKPFDAAARAKVIAPFLEEQTFAILHVDLTRIDVDATLDLLSQLLPEMRPELPEGKAQARKALAAFTEAGGKDLYCCVTLRGSLSAGGCMYIVLPVSSGANEDVLCEAVRGVNPRQFATVERVGDALLAGTRETVDRIKSLPPIDERSVSPHVAEAFAVAGDTTAQFVFLPPAYSCRVIAGMMPTLPEELGGGPSSVLTDGLRWAAVGADFPPKMTLRAVIQSRDHAAAVAMREWLGVLLQRLSENAEIRRNVPGFEQTAKQLTPTIEGDRLVLAFDKANVAALVDALRPPLEAARRRAGRVMSMNNLKMIALGMHCYYDAHKSFPPRALCGAAGKPLLSWRVLLLPYLEQDALYRQFHLDEPWDSPHNKKLIDRMPAVYRSPGSKLAQPGRTNYVVAVGPGTVFGEKQGITFKDIPDGTSNTIMVVEADDDRAVIWTKPDDLPFDAKHPNRGLGGLWGDGTFLTNFCDGSANVIRRNLDPEVLRCLFLRNDGKVVKGPF